MNFYNADLPKCGAEVWPTANSVTHGNITLPVYISQSMMGRLEEKHIYHESMLAAL